MNELQSDVLLMSFFAQGPGIANFVLNRLDNIESTLESIDTTVELIEYYALRLKAKQLERQGN